MSIALTLQEVILARAARASVSYVDYLLSKVHEGQAEERRRISRELHDRVNHSLAVVCKSLELYGALREEAPERAHEKAEIAHEVAVHALKCGSELSQDLRSSEADAGLEVALSDLLKTRVPQDIKAWASVKGDQDCMPPYIRDELFLILREAVRNAVDHSMPHNIRIKVVCTQLQVMAKVEDDGCGFNPETVKASSNGIGLTSIVERTALIGGQPSIESRIGEGARIKVEIPLAPLRRI